MSHLLRRSLLVLAAVAAGFGLAQFAAKQNGAPSWWPDRERDRQVRYFREVLQMVKENYVGDTPSDYASLTRAALEGMVAQLDPHSQFMPAEEFRETEDELSNTFNGVGIQVEERNGHVVIVAPIAGSPADRAGLRRGDQLVKPRRYAARSGQALTRPCTFPSITAVHRHIIRCR